MELVDLEAKRHDRCEGLSKGVRQRLFLAILKLAEDRGIEFAVPVKIPETEPVSASQVN